MATATHSHSKHPTGEHAAAAHPARPEIDPDHDIDAKKTLIVLGVSSAFVFGSVWVLYLIFSIVMRDQLQSKVEQSPTPQLTELREWEKGMLEAGDAPQRKSIDESIRELSTK